MVGVRSVSLDGDPLRDLPQRETWGDIVCISWEGVVLGVLVHVDSGTVGVNLLGEEAKNMGLVWGGDFNDWVHVQWPHFVTAGQLAPLRVKWMATQKGPTQNKAALQEVWKLVDAQGAW